MEAIVSAEIRAIPVGQLKPNPWNRTTFDPIALEELVASIKNGGIEEPLIVRPLQVQGSTLQSIPAASSIELRAQFEIASGHRRWLAAQKAGFPTVPCIVRELADQKVAEMNIEVNLQRENIPPLEMARMVKTYLADFGRKQKDAAEAFGKSESWISYLLGFLSLDPAALDYLRALKLSWDQLVALKRLPAENQRQIAKELKDGLLPLDEVAKRCTQLRFGRKNDDNPSAGTVPKKPSYDPDPLAKIWASLQNTTDVSGNQWGVTYGAKNIPALSGVAMPAWQFWFVNNGTLPKSDLKRWFLQMAEAMGDPDDEKAIVEKNIDDWLKKNPEIQKKIDAARART